jgi:adenylate kinase family enzyme
MKQGKLKRIAIIGLPGSGKSTFATKLGNILDIPVHHLDRHMFDGNKKRDKKEFLLVKQALVNEECWIIEGCSISTLEMRFARADTIIYFNLPRLVCIWRSFKRWLNFDKRIADTGCLKGINLTLLKYIWNFDLDKRQGIEELRKHFPNVDFIIFSSSDDANKYLFDCENHEKKEYKQSN